MVIISDETFCDPCQALLNGQGRMMNQGEDIMVNVVFEHHDTVSSFQLALELNCAICLRIWEALRREHTIAWHNRNTVAHEPLVMAPTTYRIRSYGGPKSVSTVYFHCNDYVIDLQLRPSRALQQVTFHSSKNTGDDLALRYLTDQNQKCLQNHKRCQQADSDDIYLPTRLIDVGSATDASVHLRQTALLPAGAPYVVLSHCWGKFQPTTLTKSTAALLRDGIAITSLPKTFQDAIAVTRRFEYQYLWIDSLCIIQDDVDDWYTESATMRHVYSNAAFCIAATAARDGNTGLFFDRDLQIWAPVKVEITSTYEPLTTRVPKLPSGTYWIRCQSTSDYLAVQSAPLNQRAWVAQERFLSRRIIHFAREMLFWECRECFNSDIYPTGHFSNPQYVDNSGNSSDLKTWLAAFKDRRSHDCGDSTRTGIETRDDKDFYQKWIRFRTFYTHCNLTKGDDILVALGGISQEIGTVMHDEMVAGLWKRRSIEELCWYIADCSEKPCRPPFPTGPRWSWVSSTKPILGNSPPYAQNGRYNNLVDVIHMEANATPSGALENASIVIQGRLIPVTFLSASDTASATILWDSTFDFSQCQASVYPDNVAADETICSTMAAFVLILRMGVSYYNFEASGLLIVPDKGQSGIYRRLGYCEFEDMSDPTESCLVKIHWSAEVQRIELV